MENETIMKQHRILAAAYHSGQHSALYAFASSGTVLPGLPVEVVSCFAIAAAREVIKLKCLYAATSPPVTLAWLKAHPAGEFWHKTHRNADGTPVRCRSNGAIKTWVRHPDHFRLPVKHGLKQCFYLTPENAPYWVPAP